MTEATLISPKERAQHCRAQAKELLALPGMRLHLALTLILCLTFWIGGIYLCECAFDAIPWDILQTVSPLRYYLAQMLYYLADGLAILLLGLPLLLGTTRILLRAAAGQKAPLSTLFYAFAGPRCYFRSLGLVLRLCALPALCLGMAVLLLLLAWQMGHPLPILLLGAVSLTLILCATLLAGRDAAVLPMEAMGEPASLSRRFGKARELTQGRLFDLLRFRLHFFGWALLCVATLGLVLLFHALPYFLLSYTLYLAPPGRGD